jgi:hypothetical protein
MRIKKTSRIVDSAGCEQDNDWAPNQITPKRKWRLGPLASANERGCLEGVSAMSNDELDALLNGGLSGDDWNGEWYKKA